MTESQIQKQITDALKDAGYTVFRMQSGMVKGASGRFMRLCPAGTPDLLVVRSFGQVLWIEVKVPGGKFKPAQEPMIEKLRDMGHDVLVAHSLDDVGKWFDPDEYVTGEPLSEEVTMTLNLTGYRVRVHAMEDGEQTRRLSDDGPFSLEEAVNQRNRATRLFERQGLMGRQPTRHAEILDLKNGKAF